ncbi:MAG: Deacetylases, including yeast histone deacetylase and acetoin utilization protein [uncultured Thiotrichaceae bacterium]|uniref:Deacetylases, including yeast histone deacetylase and acetoin utilization protein n=1 Tax=uncultured Thiotrichaceae bacterium TaxID=298394 RepID=A0A6S6TKV6_9GAMM|nr:MAG: Deacetylases, including yeast histone deacetylase and acetoin utilization protein [uncultured Thiotrichaceae bacterium]
MTVAIISHSDCLKHEMQEGHPECPERLSAIQDQLFASGIDGFLQHVDAPLAKHHQLELAHDSAYIDSIFDNAPTEGLYHVDPDTWMGKHTLAAALRAAGAVIEATDRVITGQNERAFCNVRPPGHHAEHDQGMGFCFFNNIVIGALHAIEHYGLSKVAVVDFDVHHGNGSEDIIGDNPHILYCSTYQDQLYPGDTGDSREGLVTNVPLKAGAGSREFRDAVTNHWLPALREFQPEIIFISAGFDAHIEDDMAQLELFDGDYVWVSRELGKVADEYAEGRIVSALEGGYILSALGRSAVAHIKSLMRI